MMLFGSTELLLATAILVATYYFLSLALRFKKESWQRLCIIVSLIIFVFSIWEIESLVRFKLNPEISNIDFIYFFMGQNIVMIVASFFVALKADRKP